MTKRRRPTLHVAIYGFSVALHVAMAAGAVLAPKARKASVVAISLSEAKKPPPKPNDPPPRLDDPPPPQRAPVKVKTVVAAAAVADSKPSVNPLADVAPSVHGAPDGFADLGLVMGNGAGMAIPGAARAADEPLPRQTTHKVQALGPARAEACDEPVVKAKLRGALIKPAYTEEARVAQIEGVVRVEMTVDEQGNVAAVKILKGIGHGLDEAAAGAARQLTFDPGTRCGKAAVTKLTVGMRFSLQQ